MGRDMRNSVLKSRQVITAASNATNTNVTISETSIIILIETPVS